MWLISWLTEELYFKNSFMRKYFLTIGLGEMKKKKVFASFEICFASTVENNHYSSSQKNQ